MENANAIGVVTKTESAAISVTKPLEFDGSLKTKIISTMELCETISSLLGPSIYEYVGCKIELNVGKALPEVANSFMYGAPYVDIYLRYRGEDNTEKIKALNSRVPVGNKDDKNISIAERFARVNRTFASTSMFTLTDDIKEALAEYMPKGKRTNWNGITEEIVNPMNYFGKDETLVRISGIDLTKLVSEIYSTKDEEDDAKEEADKKEKYEYIIEPRTPIPSQTNEFIIQIIQYDIATTNRIQSMLGNFRVAPVNFHRYGN